MMLSIINLLKERVAIAKVSSDNSNYLIKISIKEAEEGITELAQLKAGGELSEPTRQRVIGSLARFITEARHREDDCRGNLDNGSKGGYSESLTEDIKLLDELREPTPAEHGDRHHAGNTLKAAYEQGFEDTKKTILQEVQKIGK